MIAALQWITLAACAAGTASRAPAALRGRNRSLLAVYALTSLAVLLSIEGPYLAIDHALGGVNVANLLLRFLVFAAAFVLGLRIARGFGAHDALRLICGPVGIALFPAMARALRSTLPGLVWAGAALFAGGTVALTVSLVSLALPASLAGVRVGSGYAGVLFLASGLLLIRLSRVSSLNRPALPSGPGLFRRPLRPHQFGN